MKVPLTYSLREIPPVSFEEGVRSMFAEPDFLGANVTSPYKIRVVPLLDELRGDAAELKVVNTIVRQRDGKLVGHNEASWCSVPVELHRRFCWRCRAWDAAALWSYTAVNATLMP